MKLPVKQCVLIAVTALIASLASLPGYAYFSGDYLLLENSSLKGINTVSVEVVPPIDSLNYELKYRGVSSTELEQKISERLQAAGINVISREQALSEPEAAMLRLKIHLIIGMGRIYSWGLNLSLNQNAPLERSGAFHPVRTWSTGKFGGTQQTNLGIIRNYSLELVEEFIAAHHAQN